MTKIKEGCGEPIIKNMGSYSIKTSIKCGDYKFDEHKIILCDNCKKENED